MTTTEHTFSLAISHTPWVPERVESKNRLIDALDAGGGYRNLRPETGHDRFLLMGDRAPNHVWSERMWRWAAETDATHCVFLQDDVIVYEGFWNVLRTLVEVQPDAVIGLETVHPLAQPIAMDPDLACRWLTTSDGLVGVGYVIPRALLLEFLEWRLHCLRTGALEALTEDTMIGVWCLATGRRVWHPMPTIIDHDTSIASTYGNDKHTNRRPMVRAEHGKLGGWEPEDLLDPKFWRGEYRRIPVRLVEGMSERVELQRGQTMQPEPVRHVGRFYEVTPDLAKRWVKGFDEAAYMRARKDDGQREIRRVSYARRARQFDTPPAARVILASPRRGAHAIAYQVACERILRMSECDVAAMFELTDCFRWHEDVSKCRDRMARMFLETDATHLWFLDTDIECDPICGIGMLRTGLDVIAAPYPRREGINWEAVANPRTADDRHPESRAYSYPLGLQDGRIDPRPDYAFEVDWAPLGCAMISRKAIEAMSEEYRPTRHYVDEFLGREIESVELFPVERAEHGGKMRKPSEDQGFCRLWRAMGGKVYAYAGPGSPVTHHGDHAFKGRIEALGMRLLGV